MGKIYILCLFIFVLGHYPHHDTCSLSKENSTKDMQQYIIYMAYALKLGGRNTSHLPFMAELFFHAGHCTVAATTQGLL